MIETVQTFLRYLYTRETIAPHIVSIRPNTGVLGGVRQCVDLLTGEELSIDFPTPYPEGATVSFLSRGGAIFVMHVHDPAQQAEPDETEAPTQGQNDIRG